jgi:hypothetical protein
MPRGTCSEFTGPVDKVGTTYVQSMKLLGFEMKSTCKGRGPRTIASRAGRGASGHFATPTATLVISTT